MSCLDKQNEKGFIDLLKNLIPCEADMDNKSKNLLKEIIEKFHEKFIDDQELRFEEEEEIFKHMQQIETTYWPSIPA